MEKERHFDERDFEAENMDHFAVVDDDYEDEMEVDDPENN